MVNPEDVLFVGQGQSAVAWYRCYMPATALGCDYVGLVGDPPNVRYATGLVTLPGHDQKQSALPDLRNYEWVILQQPRGQKWLKVIRDLQERGVKVAYEVDDYVHGIKNLKHHDFKEGYDRKGLTAIELCMRVCDVVICSTDYIARRYRKFNPRTVVCENGLDIRRYAVTKPDRSTVNIGWAGATGHADGMAPWLSAVRMVLGARENTTFVTIGQDFAHALKPEFGDRCLSVPFCAVEQYPAAMTMFDIALGPAQHSLFHAGKSDLRWLEAGALGVPLVGDPYVYGGIRDGIDGFTWDPGDPAELAGVLLELVDDAELRTIVGQNARRYVEEERAMDVVAPRWLEVLDG